MISQGSQVAVIDDDADYALSTAGIVEEASLVPSIISEAEAGFKRPHQLLNFVQASDCTAVICDHRLSPKGLASFTGAEFVANAFDNSLPAVLLSTFAAIDGDTTIKLHRARIPSLITREDLDPHKIMDGLQRSESELAGNVTPERRPWRTLVRIESVSKKVEAPAADAIVHTWKPLQAVRFPLEVIEEESIRQFLMDNDSWPVRLFAEVNVGCNEANDLFFQNFEWAPEPDVNELAP